MADNQTKQELDSHSQKMHGKAQKPQEHSIACSKCGLKAKTADEMQGHSCATC
ncbi:MAG: hypothetical protein HYW45_03275 [Candidatus Daviesbacteria bacterium]|nr:MAG: hypothetical protein HYW45_03275 [Candidatus Daviesbacteria bacterium]